MAQETLLPFGVDLSRHRARMISQELIRWADCILVMAPQHRDAVVAMVPDAASKVRMLGAYGPEKDPERTIPDPYGGSVMHYRACTVELMEAIKGFLDTEGGAFGL
jgi:protein-tyrosine-phosphatase